MSGHPSQNSKSMNSEATIPCVDQDMRVKIGSSDPNLRWLSPAQLPESRMYSNFHQPARHLWKDERGKGRKKERKGKERKTRFCNGELLLTSSPR